MVEQGSVEQRSGQDCSRSEHDIEKEGRKEEEKKNRHEKRIHAQGDMVAGVRPSFTSESAKFALATPAATSQAEMRPTPPA